MPRYEVDATALDRAPEEVKKRAQRLLEKATEARRRNPLMGFSPYPQQAQFLAAHRARARAFFGGNRAGKSTTGVIAAALAVTPDELIPEHLLRFKPPECSCPQYGRIVVPSTKLINLQMAELLRHWMPQDNLRNERWADSYSKYEYMLRLECGCFLELMSYEMDRDKFGGSPRHFCLYDEEPPEDIRQECAARLVDWNGFELFAMTPLQGMTWMFDEIWLKAGADPDVFAVTAAMIDNPNISQEGVLKAIEKWKAWPEQLAARVYGRFVHFGGLVYPNWREWLCDTPTNDFIRHNKVIVAVDPGARNFGHSFNVFDREDRMVTFESGLVSGESTSQPGAIYEPKGATVGHSVALIRSVLRKRGIEVKQVEYVMDPAARARSPIIAETVESQYIAQGIFPNRGQNDVEAGVLEVRLRGAEGAYGISRTDTAGLQWELERYRIDAERADGRFAVVKEKDHIVDTIRYAAMERPYQPQIPEKLVEKLGPDVARPPRRPSPPVGPLGRFA